MANDKTLTITVIVVFLAAIVIIMYFLFFRKDEDIIFPLDIGPDDPPDDPPDSGPGGDGDVDPYDPPGYQVIRLDGTVSYKKSITFNFNAEYYATILSGTLRVGGSIWTNVRIEYKKDGTWRHIASVGGSPSYGQFIQFEGTINDQCSGIKFVAEQGVLPYIGDRYIDEVHGQLWVEVG